MLSHCLTHASSQRRSSVRLLDQNLTSPPSPSPPPASPVTAAIHSVLDSINTLEAQVMVSKRQRLAKARLREANPDLFPTPQLAPKAERTKKKKRVQKKNQKRTGVSKHPLRVPGMRPGESCFICKSADHIAKNCPEKSHWEKNKICLLCRQRGHSLKNCPENENTVDKKYCYNCGEVGHSLSKCPLPLKAGGMTFANCFICKEQGHLSKTCPKSTHGIYPKGGSCKVCGEVTHLAKDCPNKGNINPFSSSGLENTSNLPEGRGRHVVFGSGDDLVDDFTVEDTIKTGKKDVITESKGLAPTGSEIEKKIPVKSQKKQGPKVVNFLA